MTRQRPTDRHILAVGGGDLSSKASQALSDLALSWIDRPTPRVCWLGTAGGDSDAELDQFYAEFTATRAKAMHLSLFRRRRGDLAARLLSNDLLYIGGGNTANLLALWRLHGVDALVGEAWRAGIVLVGVSAGACCLFSACLTDAFGPPLRPLNDGLGLLDGSFCPHYEHPRRRPRYREEVGRGLPQGYAVEEGAALHFVGARLHQAVAARRGASAWRVVRRGQHTVEETLPARALIL